MKMPFRKNCVISAVGHGSLHRGWMGKGRSFDLHLIVYDESMMQFLDDGDNVCHIKGFKLKVIYKYLTKNPHILSQYDYFFFPDDDICMDVETINRLFMVMNELGLEIAQPSLKRMSYYSWPHTLQNKVCKLRYTNFVEMMVPCFSQSALRKVLFTFNENTTGWGTEMHWPLLLTTNHRDMAVVDAISVLHTRPIQSGKAIHFNDLESYRKKYALKGDVVEYGYIPRAMENYDVLQRKQFESFVSAMYNWIKSNTFFSNHIGLDGQVGYCYLLFLMTILTSSRKFADEAVVRYEQLGRLFSLLEKDMSFKYGLTGCCWLVLFVAEKRILTDDPLEILSEFDDYIRQYKHTNSESLSLEELAGLARYEQAKYKLFPTQNNFAEAEKTLRRMDELDTKSAGFDTLVNYISLQQICHEDISDNLLRQACSLMMLENSPIVKLCQLTKLYHLCGKESFKVSMKKKFKILKPEISTLGEAICMAEVLCFVISE